MAPLLRLAAALLLAPAASPHSSTTPRPEGQQGGASVDVGNLRYFTWYECCTDTNANLTLGPNLTKNPGNTQSQEGGFRGDEPALNLGKSSYTERIEGAFNQFGVPSLFGPIAGGSMGIFEWPQCNTSVPKKCYPPGGWGKSVGRLKAGWEAAVKNITTTIRPLVATGAVVGIWFGARLPPCCCCCCCCWAAPVLLLRLLVLLSVTCVLRAGDELSAAGGLPFSEYDRVISQFRKELGDRSPKGGKLIYYAVRMSTGPLSRAFFSDPGLCCLLAEHGLLVRDGADRREGRRRQRQHHLLHGGRVAARRAVPCVLAARAARADAHLARQLSRRLLLERAGDAWHLRILPVPEDERRAKALRRAGDGLQHEPAQRLKWTAVHGVLPPEWRLVCASRRLHGGELALTVVTVSSSGGCAYCGCCATDGAEAVPALDGARAADRRLAPLPLPVERPRLPDGRLGPVRRRGDAKGAGVPTGNGAEHPQVRAAAMNGRFVLSSSGGRGGRLLGSQLSLCVLGR